MRYYLVGLFVFLFGFALAQDPMLILPLGHTDIVRTARFSTDNKFVITGSADKTAKVWETFTGKKIRDLDGNKSDVLYAFFSNDNKYIAVGTDSAVRIWMVPEYKMLNEFDFIKRALFSPDSKKLFLVDFSGNVRQLDLATKKNEFLYKDSVAIGTVNLSPDSKLLCSANPPFFVVREIQTGKIVTKNKIKGKPLASFFTNDNKYLVIITTEGFQRFDINKQFQALNFISRESNLVFPGRNYGFVLATSGDHDYENSVLWDFEKYKPAFESGSALSVHDSIPLYSLTDGEIISYKRGDLPYSFPKKLRHSPPEVSHSGKYIRCRGLLWNTFDNAASYEIGNNSIQASDFSTDDNYLLIQQTPGTVSLWDIVDRKVIQTYKSNANNIRTLAISNDGNKFLISGYDSTIKICETLTGRTLQVLKGHKDLVRYAAFNQKGTQVVTNSLDSSAKLWDVGSGELVKNFPGQHPDLNPAYFISEDELVLSALVTDSIPILDTNFEVSGNIAVVNYPVNPENLPNRKSRTGRYSFHTLSGGTTVMNDVFGENQLGISCDFSVYAFSPDEKFFALANINDDTLLIRDIEGNQWLFTGRMRTIAKNIDQKKGIQQLLFSNKYLLVVDANNVIHVLSSSGKQQFLLQGQKCAVSLNSKFLITASQGECNVYDFEKVKLLYRYISVDTANYLVVDSANRFDGSDAARKSLYYACGNEIIDLEQIKALSWEPDLVSKITGVIKQPITAKKLSEINICSYTPQTESSGYNSGSYQFEVTSRKGGIGEVQLFVNGKLVKKYDSKLLQKERNTYRLSVSQNEVDSFFVSGGNNAVVLKATTREGNIMSRGVGITKTSEKKPVLNPNLYLLSVGIGKYKGETLKLNYASKDAVDFASALTLSAKKLLNTDGKQHVTSYLFNTDSGSLRWPTKKSIENALNNIKQSATADDILIIFFAGHGVLPVGKKNLLLPTAEAYSFDQVESVPETVAISFEELMHWLQKIKANKQLIILDVCNSGQVVKNLQDLIVKREIPADQQRALDNLTGTTGSCVLAASAEGQPAYETSLYGQGLLTYSLLSGLKLGKGLRDNKYVQVNTWFDVASSDVQQMAKEIGGRQDPKKFGNASFDIGLVDKEVVDSIKLSIRKRIFRRSKVVKEGIIPSDNLGLTAVLDKTLVDISARGRESPFTYIADNTLLNPYSIIGTYKLTGNSVYVNVYLIKGNEEARPLHQFELNGIVEEKEELAARIVEVVTKFLTDN